MFGSATTHALPWAGVGQTEPQWPGVLFLKKYQSSDQDGDGDDDGDNSDEELSWGRHRGQWLG